MNHDEDDDGRFVAAVGGLVNHLRRADGESTVSSELLLELAPTCAAVIVRLTAYPNA